MCYAFIGKFIERIIFDLIRIHGLHWEISIVWTAEIMTKLMKHGLLREEMKKLQWSITMRLSAILKATYFAHISESNYTIVVGYIMNPKNVITSIVCFIIIPYVIICCVKVIEKEVICGIEYVWGRKFISRFVLKNNFG